MNYSSQGTAHSIINHRNIKSYIIGFVLSIILTIIPFAMVMNHFGSHDTILAIIVGTAAIQVLVHLICFLHINVSSEQRWNLLTLIFTTIIISIIIIGSLWIMHNLNTNMMVT